MFHPPSLPDSIEWEAPLHFAAVSGDRYRLDVMLRADDQVGTRRVKSLRREGFIPGVLYGRDNPRAIAVDERKLRAALTGAGGLNAIIDVVFEGQKTEHHVVLKDYQQHPIRGTITHVDFQEVRLDRPIQSTVPIVLTGESRGVKAGGMLQQITRELRVEALPTAIPEHIDVDVTDLEVGGVLRLEDLPASEGFTVLDDLHETVIATVSIPRALAAEAEEEAEAEAEEAAAEGAAEPEASEEAPSEE